MLVNKFIGSFTLVLIESKTIETVVNFGVIDNLIVFAVLLYILCTNVNCEYGDLSFKQKKRDILFSPALVYIHMPVPLKIR